MSPLRIMTPFLMLFLIAVSGCDRTPGSENAASPTNVETTNVTPAGDTDEMVYSGSIEESESIPLSFSTPGTVSRVYVSEGQAVRKGQLLATLDNASFKNAYEMTRATLTQAEDAYRRLTPMHANGTIPEIKYTEVQTGLAQAKAAAAISKKTLDDCSLYATTDGFVGKRGLDPGMAAVPGLATITIVKIGRVFARIAVPENDIALIAKGRSATITIGALGGRTWTGSIEEIGVMADPIAHTYKVRIGIENTGREIRPGMVCNAAVHITRGRTGCSVPARSVQVDETGQNYVYLVTPGRDRAERRGVRVGRLMNDRIEIQDGLNGGEQVVVSGQHKLAPNAPVRIVNP